MLAAGQCTGVDGNCYTAEAGYELVASDIVFSNVEWPSQVMYMQALSLFSQLKVGDVHNVGDSSRFSLHKLPGTISGKTYVLLSSAKWPNWVASLCLSVFGIVPLSPVGLYALNLDKGHLHHGPEKLVVHVCRMTSVGLTDAIQIRSPGKFSGRISTAYVRHGSSRIFGSWIGDPGSGGYWKPNKPLQGLDEC
jgi:hypothetical protein